MGGSVGVIEAASRAVLMIAPRRNALSIRENACINSMVSRVVAKHLRGSAGGGFFTNTFRRSITFEFDTKHLRASSPKNYDRDLTPRANAQRSNGYRRLNPITQTDPQIAGFESADRKASVARPAFGGVEVAVQLPSRRVERRRPPKLGPCSDLTRGRLLAPICASRRATLPHQHAYTVSQLPSDTAGAGNGMPESGRRASPCARRRARILPYAAAAGRSNPLENSRAPVSMNLRVSSARCLPSSANI